MARGKSHRQSAKEQFWRGMISRQPGSGLPIRAYCRRHQVREAGFYFWRRQLLRCGVGTEAGPAFVPVRVTSEQLAAVGQSNEKPAGWIEILLAGGRQVRLHGTVDRQSLTDVLAVLEGTPC
jgi:transposase